MRQTLEELLLELGLCDFNLDRLVNLLLMTAAVIGVVLDGGGEERVDEGGLAETRLAGNLQEGQWIVDAIGAGGHELTMIVKAAPRFATILWLKRGTLVGGRRYSSCMYVPLIGQLHDS
jgi:hypothetical protein